MYAPTEDAGRITKDEFQADIVAIFAKVRKRKNIVILGDFNGRVGRKTGNTIAG